MRKYVLLLAGLLLAVPPIGAQAAVTASSSSLVTSATSLKASSAARALFEITLAQTAGEALASVAVTVANNGTSTAVGSDIASIAVYKDNGNGTFDAATDTLAGSQTTVAIGSATTVTTSSNNAIDGGKFFVTLATSGTWSSAASPVDSITVTLPASGVVTSANSPTLTAATTAAITADSVGPVLNSVVAKNTGGTAAKEAGDTIELTFSEATNKPAISAANIGSILLVNNSHSLLDGVSSIGGATWSSDGTKLTLTLSAGTSIPTVVVGDTVTVSGSTIADFAGNSATGAVAITGSFAAATSGGSDDDDDNDEDSRKQCAGGVVNGRLYKVKGSATVYLVAGCRLKPFRGAAVFRARGHKFQNITELASLPTGAQVSDKPALPAEGTLVKGDKDKTVWFVTKEGKRRGFTREEVFKKLGFAFDKVEIISQDDLNTMSVSENINSETQHPDGAIVKCENATVVFKVKGNTKQPFTSAEVFNAKGHQFKHILSIDCAKFSYAQGAAVE